MSLNLGFVWNVGPSGLNSSIHACVRVQPQQVHIFQCRGVWIRNVRQKKNRYTKEIESRG